MDAENAENAEHFSDALPSGIYLLPVRGSAYSIFHAPLAS
jgi:hypothetical protein